MGCKQCSHLLGSEESETNTNGSARGMSGSGCIGGGVGDSLLIGGSSNGKSSSSGNGGRNRNYSSGNVHNQNGNLTIISEEDSSDSPTSQVTSQQRSRRKKTNQDVSSSKNNNGGSQNQSSYSHSVSHSQQSNMISAVAGIAQNSGAQHSGSAAAVGSQNIIIPVRNQSRPDVRPGVQENPSDGLMKRLSNQSNGIIQEPSPAGSQKNVIEQSQNNGPLSRRSENHVTVYQDQAPPQMMEISDQAAMNLIKSGSFTKNKLKQQEEEGQRPSNQQNHSHSHVQSLGGSISMPMNNNQTNPNGDLSSTRQKSANQTHVNGILITNPGSIQANQQKASETGDPATGGRVRASIVPSQDASLVNQQQEDHHMAQQNAYGSQEVNNTQAQIGILGENSKTLPPPHHAVGSQNISGLHQVASISYQTDQVQENGFSTPVTPLQVGVSLTPINDKSGSSGAVILQAKTLKKGKGKYKKKSTKSHKRMKSVGPDCKEEDENAAEESKIPAGASNIENSQIEELVGSRGTAMEKNMKSTDNPPGYKHTNTLYSGFNIDINGMIYERKGKICKDYQILELLGKGGFGEVKKVVHRLTRDVRAMKIIKKDKCDDNYLATLQNEIKILKQLDHPNIVKLYEVYSDSRNIYMITEYLEGGEVFDLILKSKHFNENIAANIMKQLLSAISYCHSKKIVHRDLKPENLLIVKPNTYEIKVIDFGLSRTFEPHKNMYSRMGTPFYIAPEVLKKKYNEKCDVWACGVILYILLSGNPPFNGKNDQQIFENIALGYVSFQGVEWKNVSNEAKIFIKRMLHVQPDQRISAQQALQDPWIRIYTSAETVAPPMAMNILNNLRSFNSELKFQQAVMSYLATQLSNREEKAQLTKIFKQFDKNNDGVLSKEELILGYSQLYGSIERATLEVDQILERVDINGNGTIDYSEFLAANLVQSELLTHEKLQAAFNLFDIDQNGRITIEEIKSLLGGGGPENFFLGQQVEITYPVHSNEVWKELMGEGDADNDGEITFEEFQHMMKKLLTK